MDGPRKNQTLSPTGFHKQPPWENFESNLNIKKLGYRKLSDIRCPF